MVRFPFQIRTTNPFFQSGGMVSECHTAVKTACNPRIMASLLALSSSALMLQMPAAFPLLNFATASLTSPMQFRQWVDQHPASATLQSGAVRLEDGGCKGKTLFNPPCFTTATSSPLCSIRSSEVLDRTRDGGQTRRWPGEYSGTCRGRTPLPRPLQPALPATRGCL